MSGSSIIHHSITSGLVGCYRLGLSGIGYGLVCCYCQEDTSITARGKELTQRHREHVRVAAEREARRLGANKSGHA